MKFLDTPDLASLASRLNTDVEDEKQLSCWLEAYSMKHAGPDKKRYKEFTTLNAGSLKGLELLSPPQTVFSSTLTEELNTTSKKTLYYLQQTLNSVFTDYDFSGTGSQQFSREPNMEIVATSINTTLLDGANEAFLPIRNVLWNVLNHHIDLKNCEIYSYIPTVDDPFAEDGTIWSFNYFFLNRTLNRVLFFACRAISLSAALPYDPFLDHNTDYMDNENIFGFEMDSDMESDRRAPTLSAVYGY